MPTDLTSSLTDRAPDATATWSTPKAEPLETGDRPGWRPLAAGRRIDAFELVRKIAEGGFGEVWEATQRAPVRRTVALKVLKREVASPRIEARFDGERQALAMMDHPHIARVFDGGATTDGRPYLVMEYVPGAPITDFCEQQSLSMERRLELFGRVCAAVEHAHLKGVIHRDLKPSNVLVTMMDGVPFVKVIDFGVAKVMDGVATDFRGVTREGQMIGTPAYMSPEQASGTLDVDTRTDVYALGVLLYELLTGTTPSAASSSEDHGLEGVLRSIREDQPAKPSSLLRRHASADRHAVRTRLVQGDLDWIVLRCLEKDRERRYASVAAIADELERHRCGEPVLAGPPGLTYRSVKFVKRHAAMVIAGVLGVALLLSATGFSLVQAREARRQAENAGTELARSRTTARFLEHLLSSMDPAIAQGADTTLLRRILTIASDRMDQLAEGPPEVEATLRRILGGAFRSIAMPEEAEAQLQRALDLRRAALGPDDPATQQSEYELASLWLAAGRHDAAAKPLRRAWAWRRDRLGAGHEETLRAHSQVALVARCAGHLDEALELFAELEALCLAHLGDSHEVTMLARNNHGHALGDAGRLDEGLQRLTAVFECQKRVHGVRHRDTLRTATNVAAIYAKQGRHRAAAALLQQTLDLKRQVLPAGDPSLLAGIYRLAQSRAHLGEAAPAEGSIAEGLIAEGLAMAVQHHGGDSPFAQWFRSAESALREAQRGHR